MTIDTPSRTEYDAAFEAERGRVYPMLDKLEAECGTCLDRAKLERAARVLACPVKKHAPNWQHGRAIYALTRRRLTDLILAGTRDPVTLLDIGTAKGFSALCLLWALYDVGPPGGGRVVSCDVIDPVARVRRNTIAELDGPLTLAETLAPWPEARAIAFTRAKGRDWLTAHYAEATNRRIHVASVDGKHAYADVSDEIAWLTRCQAPGDVIFFDDYQIEGVRRAIVDAPSLTGLYTVATLHLLPERAYAIARRT